MKLLLSLVLLTTFSFPQWPLSVADKVYFVTKHLQSAGLLEGTVLCATNGVIAFEECSGKSSYEWNITNTVHTRYYLASLGKSFTAYIIVKLADEGLLSLRDRASKYLPELLHSPYGAVTIYQLLTHTSGMPDLFRYVRSSALSQSIGKTEYLKRLVRQVPVACAGEIHYYSNSGYAVLGWVAEEASGLSFRGLLERYIVSPLGLHNTGVLESGTPIKGMAFSYLLTSTGAVRYPSSVDISELFTAGNIYSSVEDLNKWVNFLKSVHNTSPYNQIWQPWVKAWFPGLDHLHYGYAWRIQDLEFDGQYTRVIFHTGKLGGSSGIICYYPDLDLTLIFLGNHYSPKWKEFPGLVWKKQVESALFDIKP